MKYRLIIFDLDGTLLDTLDDLTDGVNFALRSLSMKERSRSEVLSFVGNGNRVLMERSVPEGTDPETSAVALQKFHEYYSCHYADRTRPYDGIDQLLAELKAMGYLLAVISNKVDYAVQDICRIYFDGIFDFAIGDREGIRRKPASDPVDLCLKELNVRAEQALYIGDSEVDLATAANAGVECLSVDWGFRQHEVLVEAGARTIVSSPDEIKEYI